MYEVMVYETCRGYQVDVEWGSYEFCRSRLSPAPAVELLTFWPKDELTEERAMEALEIGRANGLPL